MNTRNARRIRFWLGVVWQTVSIACVILVVNFALGRWLNLSP